MDYPTKLLPNPNYKLINCNLNNNYLVRYTNSNDISEYVDQSTGFVKAIHICSPRENIRDLSTSLLGVFKHLHLAIELTAKGKMLFQQYCQPNINVQTPVYKDDFILNKNRGCWHLLIGNVQNTKVDYKINNESFKAECKVLHTPMKWNYWHFSVRWILSDGDYWNNLDPKSKKNWWKRLAMEARSHIQMFAKVAAPVFNVIEEKEYKERF